MSSKAVTISPDTIFRMPGCAWSDIRWCDHTVQDTTSSTKSAARAMFSMKSFFPVISVASRYQVPATKISTSPSAIRSSPHQNQFLYSRASMAECFRSMPEYGGDHVNQDQHAGEKNDPRN